MFAESLSEWEFMAGWGEVVLAKTGCHVAIDNVQPSGFNALSRNRDPRCFQTRTNMAGFKLISFQKNGLKLHDTPCDLFRRQQLPVR